MNGISPHRGGLWSRKGEEQIRSGGSGAIGRRPDAVRGRQSQSQSNAIQLIGAADSLNLPKLGG